MRVDLLRVGAPSAAAFAWPLGSVRDVAPTPAAISDALAAVALDPAVEFCLLWDARLGAPDPERVAAAARLPGDVWHAGLRLGTGGLPRALDFVHPTWMLNRDADPAIVATSWRVSLGACLVRAEVLRTLGPLDATFDTLTGAGLEWGYRWLRAGAVVRHVPDLVGDVPSNWQPERPTIHDELRFVRRASGRFWLRWAVWRALANGYPLGPTLAAYRRAARGSLPACIQRYCPKPEGVAFDPGAYHDRVSVLIPTLQRYPYLWTVLRQLSRQTVRPREVICVDQTPLAERDATYAERFPDLPLRVIYQDVPGQCSSRNAGLRAATGDYVLFLDDDVEIPDDLIESHLRLLAERGADVSSGTVDEVGAQSQSLTEPAVRVNDGFPTTNTLIRRESLADTGLFDLAYDRGSRADGDLGMRFYLAGKLLLLNPSANLLHHHAPRGGLRAHRARVITYASSRQRLLVRHLPSVTQQYLVRRYFAPAQVREGAWLEVFGTFSVRGSAARKLAKVVVSLLALPHTLWSIRASARKAEAMLRVYPQIPTLADAAGGGALRPSRQPEAGSVR